MASIKVFGSPTSTEVARVLACLFEKDVEFQLIRMDQFNGAERKLEYLKRQPLGQALTYEEGKTTLVDSRDICRHVGKKYPDQGNRDLMGTGTLERAWIEQWLQTEENSFDVPTTDLVFHLALSPVLGLPNTQKLMGTECAALFMSKKKVREWWNRISSRPSWRRVLAMQNEPVPIPLQ